MKEVIKNLSEYARKRSSALLLLSLLWLCAIAGVAFVWNLGNIGLVDETEPLFAEAARQMTVTGDFITPYFNGDTRFDKPPLVYWLMAVAYRAIGVNEWAVRIPSALSAIALTCLGFYTLSKQEGSSATDSVTDLTDVRKKEEGRRNEESEKFSYSPNFPLSHSPRLPIFLSTPWIGAALIALNPETIAWGRTGVSDMLLTGCMCSALLAFFLGYALEEQREKAELSTVSHSRFPNQWYLTFYVLIALAILTKGPVGI
ncbi:MAG: glycosyltransferase family 39 protein, partial [Microcoleus sp.]